MELEQNFKKKKKKTKNPMQHRASQKTEKSCQQLLVKAYVFKKTTTLQSYLYTAIKQSKAKVEFPG